VKNAIEKENPVLIIYNYHPATMNWLKVSATSKIKYPQIGIIHEVTQQVADKADNSLFNFHIAHDPTLLLKNPLVFKAGRLIPSYENKFDLPEIPTIGSFGFGTDNKGFEKIVKLVQKEFDRAIIRFNIPFATFGDSDGTNARRIAENCRQLLINPNFDLQISHNFLEQTQLLDFLAQNTINIFLYEGNGVQRGISSATDFAMAVKRPIAISQNSMFRHLFELKPAISIDDNSLKTILTNGFEPLRKSYQEWSEETLRWDYERIAKDILSRKNIPQISINSRVKKTLKRVKQSIKNHLGIKTPVVKENSWIADTSIKNLKQENLTIASYIPAVIPGEWSLNNILDNQARKLYKTTIEQMFEYLPNLMARKIPEANVQQAFVLDTVFKIVSKIERPKILCVGSFEDSASEALKVLGFEIDEVDPMINYDLSTFMTKPTTVKNSYDLVFSTSVIEHVKDDEDFLINIAALLKKNGKAVLTCDYCDTYKLGDPIFDVNYRFYTQRDIKERLLSKLLDCSLIEDPQWDCPNPDFFYDGFNYTFATIVLKKH
ncbi:MAG: methyltransferase domain-containing protein, partial [Acidobacteriota bacterium]